MSTTGRSTQFPRSCRPVFLAVCLASGLGLADWLDGAAAPRPGPETPDRAPIEVDSAPVAADPAPPPSPLGPAVRYTNLETLISRLERRVAKLQAEHARLGQIQISFDRKPDFRESGSEVEFRGRRSMDLTCSRIAIERQIEDLERRIDELRVERKGLADRHDLE